MASKAFKQGKNQTSQPTRETIQNKSLQVYQRAATETHDRNYFTIDHLRRDRIAVRATTSILPRYVETVRLRRNEIRPDGRAPRNDSRCSNQNEDLEALK